MNNETRAALAKIMSNTRVLDFMQSSGAETANACPCIECGSIAVGWDGSVSPCLPLLRSHTVFLFERKRFSRRHFMGNVTEHGLKELWNMRAFVSFRERVQTFDFSLVFIMAALIFLYQMKRLVSGMSFQPAGAVSGRRASYNIPEISKTTKVVRN